MQRKLSDRRRRAGILTLILAVAILVTGTLAWQAISQRAVNNVAGELLPAGARLHDDFGLADEPDFTQPLNKDVYVENYSGQNPKNTNDTGEPVFVRIKLMEYMEMGEGAGLFTLSGNDPSDYQTLDQVDANGTRVEDPANDATSLVAGASILELSTWHTHIQGDIANPFTSYWNWTMGGTKAFMPTFNKDNTSLLTDRTDYAHDKFTVGDKENGTALYSNPAYDNNLEEHTAKDTLATAGIVSMAEWMNDLGHPIEDEDGKGYWVGDTDGWYYWSKGLEAGEATALLLDQITLSGTVEGEFYYGIHVISEMATAYDWGDATDETGFYEDGLTGDGKYLLDQAAGAKKKLLYAPMDDIGTARSYDMLLHAPMDGIGTTSTEFSTTDAVTGTTFSAKGGTITQSTNSKIGENAVYFSGASVQRLNATMPSLNFGTKDFAISFWANPDTQTQSYAMPFAEDSNAVFDFIISDANTGTGRLAITLGSSYTRIISTAEIYSIGVWTHYAVVRKNGVFTAYVNGQAVGSNASYTTTPVNMSNFSIGGNGVATTGYKGYIDDFAIYDRAIYDGDFTPPTTAQTGAQLLYLDFEAKNQNADSLKETISNNNFTNMMNGPIIGKDDAYKFGGSSLYFPGTNGQRINIKNPDLNFGTGNFTISFWANPETQIQGYAMPFAEDSNGVLDFMISDGGNGRLTIALGGGNTRIISTTETYKVGVWTHYTIVRNDGVFTVYVNGQAVGSSASYPTAAVNMSDFSIGGNGVAGSGYKGYIDDFAIYNYAKYNSNFTPPTVTSDVDPANIETEELDIKDNVTGGDFTVLGDTDIVGVDTQKKFGSASLHFPGVSGQRINIQNADLNFGTEDFTFSYWVNPDATQPKKYPQVFGHENNNQLRSFIADYNIGGCISLYYNEERIITTTKKYTANVWTHYAVVRKDGVFSLYENGEILGTNSAYKTTNIDLSSLSIAGNSSTPDTAYKGYMDDFAIYNYAVWNSDFTSPTAPGKP